MSDTPPNELSSEDRLDILCTTFERQWQAGLRPQIDTFLKCAPAAERERLRAELLEIESELRRGDAAEPTVEHVDGDRFLEQTRIAGDPGVQRASSPDAASADVASTIIPPRRAPSRHQYPIRLNCPHCRNPVTLADHSADGHVLCPVCGSPFLLDPEESVSWSPERLPTLGKYQLLDKIGRGSFGSVYRAHDPGLDEVVAVKVPRSGRFAQPEDEEQFLSEAKSLARLRHRGIVPVYAADRCDGMPFIVTEYIDGVTLSDALTGRQFGFDEAAEIVAQVAETIEFAHQRGVIHRDLKPSNIMLRGGDALRMLVMDFGLALQEQADLTVTTDGQIVGSPAYMSPEQARGESHKVDGRSDVYSLGVILYQLLVGEVPFRGNMRMLLYQVLHEPPRSPRRINDQIPRDLETITLKCLAKEPSQRYLSAAELAADLRRWQHGQPIQARSIGTVRRMWMWLRRNQRLTGLIGLVAVLLVVLAIVATKAAVAGLAALVILSLVGVVIMALVSAVRLGRMAGQERRARYEAETNLKCARAAVDEMLSTVGQDWLAHVPQMDAIRRVLLQKALSFYQEFLRQRPSDDKARRDIAMANRRVGDICRLLGNFETAQTAYDNSIQEWSELVRDDPGNSEFQHQLASTHDYFGELLRCVGAFDRAEDHYRAALQLQEALISRFPEASECRQELARTENNYGILQQDRERHRDAEEMFRRSIERLTVLIEGYPADSEYQRDLARSYINLGVLLRRVQRSADAEWAYERAVQLLQRLVDNCPLEEDYRFTLAVSLVDLGNLMLSDGSRLETAEKRFQAARTELERLSSEFPSVPRYREELANCLNSLGGAQALAGRLPEAWTSKHRAQGLLEQLQSQFPTVPEYKSRYAVVTGGLAWIAAAQNQLRQAAELVEQAIHHQQAARHLAPDHGNYARYECEHLLYSAEIFTRLEQAEDAIERLRRAVELGYDDPMQVQTLPQFLPLHSHSEFQRLFHLEQTPPRTVNIPTGNDRPTPAQPDV